MQDACRYEVQVFVFLSKVYCTHTLCVSKDKQHFPETEQNSLLCESEHSTHF